MMRRIFSRVINSSIQNPWHPTRFQSTDILQIIFCGELFKPCLVKRHKSFNNVGRKPQETVVFDKEAEERLNKCKTVWQIFKA